MIYHYQFRFKQDNSMGCNISSFCISNNYIYSVGYNYSFECHVQMVSVFRYMLQSKLRIFQNNIFKVINRFYVFYYRLTYTAYVFTGITGVVFFSSITRFSRVWFLPEQVHILTLRKTQNCRLLVKNRHLK